MLAGKSETQKDSADYRCVMMLMQPDHDKAETEEGRIYKYINVFLASLTNQECE